MCLGTKSLSIMMLDCITALLQFCHAINDVISSLVIASIINSEA